jgi:hypothetical protein
MIADRVARTWAWVAVVAGASLLLGVATFLAQGVLPDAFRSFANSASGWTVVTVLLLTRVRVRPAVAALLGATSFALLTVGYTAAARLQDLYYNPALFVVVGVVVGPFVGVASIWLRALHSSRSAMATSLLAGIGTGEAIYGLTVVADTTSPVYWVLIATASFALLVTMLIRRIHEIHWRLFAVIGTCITASAFNVAYGLLGGG